MLDRWAECSMWVQAMLIAYDQIRTHEETKFQVELAKAKLANE